MWKYTSWLEEVRTVSSQTESPPKLKKKDDSDIYFASPHQRKQEMTRREKSTDVTALIVDQMLTD